MPSEQNSKYYITNPHTSTQKQNEPYECRMVDYLSKRYMETCDIIHKMEGNGYDKPLIKKYQRELDHITKELADNQKVCDLLKKY